MKKRTIHIGMLLLGMMLVACAYAEMPPEAGRATFAVQGYGVGAAALEGRPGILAVHKDWYGHHEVNRVDYDPNQVSVSQMEEWLKEAGTNIATLQQTLTQP